LDHRHGDEAPGTQECYQSWRLDYH